MAVGTKWEHVECRLLTFMHIRIPLPLWPAWQRLILWSAGRCAVTSADWRNYWSLGQTHSSQLLIGCKKEFTRTEQRTSLFW